MFQSNMRFSACVVVLLVTMVTGQANDEIDYAAEVFPILSAHCVGCHAVDEAEGGLVMESHAALMKGGKSGSAVTPGVANSSRLLLRVSGKATPRMPPEGEEPLSDAQIELLTQWIEQGAVGPNGSMPPTRLFNTPMIKKQADVLLPVTAIAVSDDESRRAIARSGAIELIDKDGKLVHEFTKEVGKVNAMQFSRDGSKLLIASGVSGAYGTALVFSTQTGDLLLDLGGHRDVLYAARFSPDGKYIATAGYDRRIVLWDSLTGERLRSFDGHNGAIYDLAFSPDGKVLISGCADETVKVWNVASGQRLDTLSQPEGEVFAVGVTSDGKFVLAGSADNRLRVWALKSIDSPQINPILVTQFVDETPLLKFRLTADGRMLVVLSEGGNVKLIDTRTWVPVASLEPLPHGCSDLTLSADGKEMLVSLMNGEVVKRAIPLIDQQHEQLKTGAEDVFLDLGELTKVNEPEAGTAVPSNGTTGLKVPRGAEIAGNIGRRGEADLYQWKARQGEVWAIDADAIEGSQIDPLVAVLDAAGRPVLRTRLQAVRDSYFTFRGKDSKQIGDFRLFNWQEMHLNDYLYAAGEVTRLWMYPRGPDSGYNLYPNEGNRWTYFGTSQATHALGEPAYIVRPLASGETPVANGLPIFDLFYENDDDPHRTAGNNSRLLFKAPDDGVYTVRVSDTRGDGGETFGYRLLVRAATPAFMPSLAKPKADLRRGSGREVIVRVDRMDGFDGPVTFEVTDLPPGVTSDFPVTIEAGQRYAVGTIWAAETAEPWTGTQLPQVIARATVVGRLVERRVGDLGALTLGERPSVIPSIQPPDRSVSEAENWTLQVRRGQSVAARVVVRRKEGFSGEVSFGKENSGRNTTHGVYVDNIGLSGLLVRQGEDERGFVLTADPIAQPGKRSFFLRAEVDGNITTHPITVEVLP